MLTDAKQLNLISTVPSFARVGMLYAITEETILSVEPREETVKPGGGAIFQQELDSDEPDDTCYCGHPECGAC